MPEHAPQSKLPIIAIGASAGGLEACRALLRDMPGDVPAAFVLVLHLDPSHDSMMVDLLARRTQLDVVQATEGASLKPGCLYVIPPGVYLTIKNRVVHLSKPDSGKTVRLPFDKLLRSIAVDAGAGSACIVLSGTATDGTLGIADIHAAGGLVIAQDPDEAGYSGMPENAIATGFVAQVLHAEEMVGPIETFARSAAENTGPVLGRPTPEAGTRADANVGDKADYDDLLSFLGTHATQDISLYKRGTLERRTARRMALVGLGPNEIGRYLDMLRTDPQERKLLSADLLIHVTSFFRDPDAFDRLSAEGVPDLIAALPENRPLRIWVAGCSTGEEAYSLAMICLEQFQTAGVNARMQILASDIDADAIATAREGFFPPEIEATVSPERLARFFIKEDGGWRVTSALRDIIVFTVADLLSDPPFSRIDLVSCRNVLIYLGPEAQKRVIARCCFALRRGGLLFLGSAEIPGANDSCFAVVDKTARLWRRVGESHPADMQFSAGLRADAPASSAQNPVQRSALADLCRRIILEHYAPAAVLMNKRLEVVYRLGPTERYLSMTQGHPDPGLIGMLPKAIRAKVRSAAASCSLANPLVTVPCGRISGAASFDIALHAVAAGSETLLLACFIDTPSASQGDENAEVIASESGRNQDLASDLEATRGHLNDALRDLEQEVEAHSANAAEALSVNEEFQSTNEELLASKEELQSLNEELTALNTQLQETLERHRAVANDLQNVLYSTDVATLFLDLDLAIRFFTPAARAIFRVIPTDIGRPLADLASVCKDDDLEADARAVLAASEPKDREIQGADNHWYLRRIQPYRVEGNRVEGVVMTYLDITNRKRVNANLAAARDEANRATRAKSRFLAAASHDLRQPMQSIALLHKLLARKKPSTEAMRLTNLLDQTLTSMTSMLDSMLEVNRINSGVVRPNLKPTPLAALIKRLVDEFQPEFGRKGLKLRMVPCKAVVDTDPQLLEQILRNLLSNALKYTSKGGVLIGCRPRGTHVSVIVCDTGIGMTTDELETIFDAYQRGEQAISMDGTGLGLGLSIVKRLADLMDHPVSVRSTLGKGSSFAISLPVAQAEAETTEPIDVAFADGKRQTGTVLVVEDEEPLRGLLAQVLEQEGHTVIAKADAKSALAWASGDAPMPDLLLTDFDLRGDITGLKLAQDLPNVLGKTVPVIILTGDITAATQTSIAKSPCHPVTKPVVPEVLLALISNLMRKADTKKAGHAALARNSVITAHVVDDDPSIRETMRRVFEAEGWKALTYASAESFLAAPRSEGPGCVLVDNILPGMDGVTLIKKLRDEKIDLPAIMLTGHGDPQLAVAAMRAGAKDLIEKPASAAELLASVRQAIKAVEKGHLPAGTRGAARERFANLTNREREVLAKVLEGAPNKIIAHELGINQRTVENHRASVMRKTEANSLPDLVRLALMAGLQAI